EGVGRAEREGEADRLLVDADFRQPVGHGPDQQRQREAAGNAEQERTQRPRPQVGNGDASEGTGVARGWRLRRSCHYRAGCPLSATACATLAGASGVATPFALRSCTVTRHHSSSTNIVETIAVAAVQRNTGA